MEDRVARDLGRVLTHAPKIAHIVPLTLALALTLVQVPLPQGQVPVKVPMGQQGRQPQPQPQPTQALWQQVSGVAEETTCQPSWSAFVCLLRVPLLA